jgi:opacity protein-like surface antigen
MKTNHLPFALGGLLGFTGALPAQILAQPQPYSQAYPQPVAFDQPAAPRFELSPFYGYGFGGEVQSGHTGRTYGFDDGEAYGLFLDMAVQPDSPYKYELLWSHRDSSVNLQGLAGLGRVDLTLDQIQIGGSYEMGGKHFRQYVSLLAGATYCSPEGFASDTHFSLGLGGGVKYFLTRNLALRADVRGFCTVVDGSGGFISSGGSTVVVYSGTAIWQGQITVGMSLAF